MPNYCENILIASHITPELRSFLEENGLSFEKIAPLNTQENTMERLDEQVKLWGTKWDLDEAMQKECAASLIESCECRFDTAWSPPEAAIQRLSEMFPDIYFDLYYVELGCAFAGAAYFEAGHCNQEDVDFDDKKALAEFLVDQMNYDPADAAEFANY
jgi:hypothetical protein